VVESQHERLPIPLRRAETLIALMPEKPFAEEPRFELDGVLISRVLDQDLGEGLLSLRVPPLLPRFQARPLK
jgi:hypothetical protein